MSICVFLCLAVPKSVYSSYFLFKPSNLSQDAVFTKLLEQEVEFYDKAGPGEITSYLSQDISGLKGKESEREREKKYSRARPPKNHKAHLQHTLTLSQPFSYSQPDILYGNLQRDRGLRAILEAIVGTILLFKLQPRLGLLFSLVIPSVATITVSFGGKQGKKLVAKSALQQYLTANTHFPSCLSPTIQTGSTRPAPHQNHPKRRPGPGRRERMRHGSRA